MSEVCPQCSHPTTPDNIFPVSDGAAYHILCYQDACIAAGQPDPFPKCDGCDQIIWEFDSAGELQLLVRGSVAFKDASTGETNWRAARFHPVCAPPDGQEPGEDDDEPAEKPADENGEPLRVVQNDDGTFAAVQPEPEPVTQAQDDGFPICPHCERPIQRSATKFADLVYHKTCAAKVKASVTPRTKHSKSPKCPTCSKGVTATQVATDKTIECELDNGDVAHYHRACYRKACLAAGMEDPFPPEDPKATRSRLMEGQEKKKREKKAETVHCGICSQNVLRVEFVEHVKTCAASAEAADGAAAE